MPPLSSEIQETISAYRLIPRWQFSIGQAPTSKTGFSPSWQWSQAHSWTGEWSIGQLFLWTILILLCMFGGVLVIALIFWFFGMLDNRRDKRLAREKIESEGEKNNQRSSGKEKQKERKPVVMPWKMQKMKAGTQKSHVNEGTAVLNPISSVVSSESVPSICLSPAETVKHAVDSSSSSRGTPDQGGIRVVSLAQTDAGGCVFGAHRDQVTLL